MQIKITLIASLSVGKFNTETREYPMMTRVKQVIEDLGIPEKNVGVILINGKHASPDDSLEGEDTLLLLPLMDGG